MRVGSADRLVCAHGLDAGRPDASEPRPARPGPGAVVQVRREGPVVNKDLVVIHQMGKVGSSTITRTLRAELEGTHDVFKTHFLNKRRRTAHLDSLKRKKLAIPIHLHKSRHVLAALENRNGRAVKVITMTREPIARNISAYFQNYEFTGSEKVRDLARSFLEQYPHDLPLTWLDHEIRDVFGFDVYDEPFDPETGYSVLEDAARGVSLLIIRMESLPSALENRAIENFLGISPVDFAESFNVGDEKNYAELYRKFKSSVRFEQDLLDRMYDSKYSRHFYSADEIRGFREKWAEKPQFFDRVRRLRRRR